MIGVNNNQKKTRGEKIKVEHHERDRDTTKKYHDKRSTTTRYL
jgi:hypothetical protein